MGLVIGEDGSLRDNPEGQKGEVYPVAKSQLLGNLGDNGLRGTELGKVHRFFKHPGYRKLREKYGGNPDCFAFFASVKIQGESIIVGKKKFSILDAEHDGINVFCGDRKDMNGELGDSCVTYIYGKHAENIAAGQNRKLFNNLSEVEEFIGTFPGDTIKDKVLSFVTLFDLKMYSGIDAYNKTYNKKYGKSRVGHVALTKITGDGNVGGVVWEELKNKSLTARLCEWSGFHFNQYLTFEELP